MTFVKMFDRLLKSNSDQQPDNNRRDVDEEVFPRVGWFVWCMNVEHKRSSVYSYRCIVTFLITTGVSGLLCATGGPLGSPVLFASLRRELRRGESRRSRCGHFLRPL